jgi:DNA-binding NtrC family response regulator
MHRAGGASTGRARGAFEHHARTGAGGRPATVATGNDRIDPRGARAGAPDADAWAALCAQARLYLAAGAWRSAHEWLDPHLDALSPGGDIPHHAIEALCLRLAACARLGHETHVAQACALLQRAQPAAAALPPEARVLFAHALASEATSAGRYGEARARLAALPEAVLAATGVCTRARIALLRGHLAAVMGEERDAEREGLAAAAWALSAGSASLRGDAFSLLAIIARRRGALAEANSLYAQASQVYWHSGNLSGHAVVQLNRAWAVGLIGLLPQSVALFQEALQQANSLGRASTALRARLGLGWVALRTGELTQARARLLAVWRETRRRRMPREETLALQYLAEVGALAGRLPQARVATRCAEALATRLAPEGDLAIEVRIRRGVLALAHDDARGARADARAARLAARRAGLRWEEAQALRIEAQALAALGRRREARSALRRALSVLQGMGEQLERRVVQAWIDALQPRGASRGLPPVATDEPDSAALRFWLAHPLLGPGGLLRAASRAPAAREKGEEEAARARRAMLSSAARTRVDAGEVRVADGGAHPAWRELGLVTRSHALRDTLHQVEIYARGRIPALVLGETGTGKDLIAQGLHAIGGAPGRFVAVNCAAARGELFVAELFGARRGAYTGAVADRPGLVLEAERGTLFLDEIADLPADAQGYLLRFLDTGEVRSLGETKSRRIEARVVAATCIDLRERVAEGRFRPDLYGRLAGLVLRVPPLRERPEDLECIVEALWLREGGDVRDRLIVFAPEVLAALREWHWPGNVRELRHAVSRALLFTQTHGPEAARASVLQWCETLRTSPPPVAALTGPWNPALAEAGAPFARDRHAPPPPTGRFAPWAAPCADRAGRPDGPEHAGHAVLSDSALREALAASGGRVALAARRLGISRSHAYRLYRRLKTRDAA